MPNLYVDETGDPGFLPGSSRLFLACALAIDGEEAMRRAHAIHGRISEVTGWRGELRWSRIPNRIRKAAIPLLGNLGLPHHACLWSKRQPTALRPAEIEARTRAAALEPLFQPGPARIHVMLDGGPDTARSRILRQEILRRHGPDVTRRLSIHWGDSAAHPGLQLADLLAGFILERHLEGLQFPDLTVGEF